jgi:hypothetical protein
VLPSSTRKHVRQPRSASKSFETPPNQVNPWDVSGGDFEIGLPEGQASVQEKDAGPDYDEVEYMPPRPVGESLCRYILS